MSLWPQGSWSPVIPRAGTLETLQANPQSWSRHEEGRAPQGPARPFLTGQQLVQVA